MKRLQTDYLDFCLVHAIGEAKGPGGAEKERKRLLDENMLSAVEKLKKDGKKAQDARKAAMKALAGKHPAKDPGGFEPVEVPRTPPPSVSGSDSLPRMEHHGYFRFRADLFNQLGSNRID